MLAYKSHKLKYAYLNYLVYEKELLAVVHALKVWQHYMLGTNFKIKIDHQSLKDVFTLLNMSRRQSR